MKKLKTFVKKHPKLIPVFMAVFLVFGGVVLGGIISNTLNQQFTVISTNGQIEASVISPFDGILLKGSTTDTELNFTAINPDVTGFNYWMQFKKFIIF